MAFVYGDRVKETSVTTGLGPFTLAGATAGFQSFSSGVGIGNECFYGIVHTGDNTWEMGRGTVGVGILSRDTVISSSNANAPVTFLGGDKIVYTTVPSEFFSGALDTAAHEAINHTVAPFNLLDVGTHALVDHTAFPLNLLTSGAHEIIDHTASPFFLLNETAHEGIDHRLAPYNLLDENEHSLIDHKAGPLFLLDAGAHALIDHTTPAFQSDQVTVPERTAGTETALRSFSPEDVAVMAGIFGGGGGGGLNVKTFAPTTFSWSASNTAINTNAVGFTPLIAFAFATFHHSAGNLTPTSQTSISVGMAVSGNAYSHGTNAENVNDGDDHKTTYASGSIAGVSSLGGGTPYLSAWDLATVNVNQFTASGIILQPSAALTGNLTLIVLG